MAARTLSVDSSPLRSHPRLQHQKLLRYATSPSRTHTHFNELAQPDFKIVFLAHPAVRHNGWCHLLATSTTSHKLERYISSLSSRAAIKDTQPAPRRD